jgi:hypothetical protein
MNRETYPATLSPLLGDVLAGAGATGVIVTGLQGIPLRPSPTDQQILRYIAANGDWEPSDATGTVIRVNLIPASDDPLVFVNGTFILVNGA